MSRSYRLPYATWCSAKSSAKQDKQLAARSVRRKQNAAIRNTEDFENLLVPHKYECSGNDVWGWGRDGKQFLHQLDHNAFNPFYLRQRWEKYTYEELVERMEESLVHKMDWIEYLKRK